MTVYFFVLGQTSVLVQMQVLVTLATSKYVMINSLVAELRIITHLHTIDQAHSILSIIFKDIGKLQITHTLSNCSTLTTCRVLTLDDLSTGWLLVRSLGYLTFPPPTSSNHLPRLPNHLCSFHLLRHPLVLHCKCIYYTLYCI